MARPGINYFDVETAAKSLQVEGKPLTLTNIRSKLGTGSKGTLAKHLREFKAKHPMGHEGSGHNIPPALLFLVEDFWLKMNEDAELRFQEEEETYQQQLHTLNNENQTIRKEKLELLNQISKLSIHNDTLLKNIEEKNGQINKHEATTLSLSQEKNQLENQLAVKKEENIKLHEHLNNMQRNLEHFQNHSQQIQTQLKMELDETKALHTREIKSLEQEYDQLKAENIKLGLNQESLQSKLRLLETDKESANRQISTTLSALKEKDIQIAVLESQLQDRNNEKKLLEQNIGYLSDQSLEQTKTISVLTEQLNQLDKVLSSTQDALEKCQTNMKFQAAELIKLEQNKLVRE